MKKKLIRHLAIVTCLTIGAGVGTYAAFRSTATSKETKIMTGRIEINGARDSLDLGEWINTEISSQVKKAGDETVLNKIEIKNTGNLNMIIKPTIDLTFIRQVKDSNTVGEIETSEILDKYVIKPIINPPSSSIGNISLNLDSNGYISLRNFKSALDSYKGWLAKPNETFTIEGNIKLDSSAENKYQGTGVKAKLSVTAEQES